MSSNTAIRALSVGLGLVLLAGSARAGDGFTNFEECESPTSVPGQVLGTILDDGSLGFGELSEKVCNSITNSGVSLCKTQVKAAAKCNEKTNKALYDIIVKQCKQLDNDDLRSACKSAAKNDLDFVKTANKDNQTFGLNDCESGIEASLLDACLNGVLK